MNRSKALMLPVVASLALLLAITPNPAFCQSTEEADATVPPTTTTTTSTGSATPEVTFETTTSAITTELPSLEASASDLSPTSTTPEGFYNSPCNATYDCQPHKNLECLEGVCHCPAPQHFDLHAERCVIPLGKQCDSSDIIGENKCPEFAECFMDLCVCKTGYSMHTLTRCKSDTIEPSERKPAVVLWPPQQAKSKSKEDDNTSAGGCTSETCDDSKGLMCQEETCVCKDSSEIFVEEFGRCLNTTMQKTLTDALSIVSTSEDEIKSFVKLLEKFDDADQATEGSDHYNSPVHQLLGLLGGEEYRSSHHHASRSSSQVAPPHHSYNGELESAAQETVTESTLPDNGTPGEENMASSGSGNVGQGSQSSFHPSPESPISPVSAANAESSAESGEALPYSQESGEGRRPSHHTHHLPLDNLHYSPQSPEPSIVQRQAPPYLQGGEGIPLNGLGVIPGGNQFRLPIQGGGYGGYGGQGGYPGYEGLGGFGGGYPGGFGGHQGGGYGGYPGGFGGYKEPEVFKGPLVKEEPKEGLLFDVAEFVGKSLKLMDRFLPLIHAINDVLKKEKVFLGKDKEGPFKSLSALLGPGRKFGDISKENDGEGGILSGFARFVGMLVRLRHRLSISGDGSLKKLLA